MEEVKVVNTTSNNSIIIIITFIFTLAILGLIIWIIILLIPKNNVQLFGHCTHQLDCSTGLVCSQTVSNTVCLNGLAQLCNTDSECAAPLVCSENSDKVKVCMVKTNPIVTLNTTMSNLVFEPSAPVLQPIVQVTPVQPVTLQPITQVETIRYQPAIGASSQSYNQNRIQLSPLMGDEKKKLTRYL